jgi:hypothetical protein
MQPAILALLVVPITARHYELLDHLEDCTVPLTKSLPALAEEIKPSKFGYDKTRDSSGSGQTGDLIFTHVAAYQRVYAPFMEPFRTKKFTFLELGLDTGSSLSVWLRYFPCAVIHGVDLVGRTAHETREGRVITTHVGNASTPEFLSELIQRTGQIDVIVDDAGHHVADQFATYKFLFSHGLRPGGLYAIEDIETSYWRRGQDLYGEPLRGPSGCTSKAKGGNMNVVDAFKEVIDAPINGMFSDHRKHVIGEVDHWIRTASFAQGIIILTKKDRGDCFAAGPYIWSYRLHDSCPAHKQPKIPTPDQNPYLRWCLRESGWDANHWQDAWIANKQKNRRNNKGSASRTPLANKHSK